LNARLLKQADHDATGPIADPHETRNLVGQPQYSRAVARFRTRCAELGFGEDADTQYVNAGY